VIVADPRGMGDGGGGDTTGGGAPFGYDWKEAFLSLHLNRPLLGQRVADLLGILAGLAAASEPNGRAGFHVLGIGRAGPIVLHAALLDDRGLIKQVTLDSSLVSWADIVEYGNSRDQLANVVPGVLQAYDLPDLAARLAPMPLAIRNPVDAMGKPISRQAMERAYTACTRAYGSGGPLVLEYGQGATPSR
jgi:hypothetical protein